MSADPNDTGSPRVLKNDQVNAGNDDRRDPNERMNRIHEAEFQEYFNHLQNWTNEFKNYFQNIALTNTAYFNNIQNIENTNRANQLLATHPDWLLNSLYEVRYAPLWKRFVAELIDGFMLFLVKVIIIKILHDGGWKSSIYFGNSSMLLTFDSEFMIVDIISRILIFLYESYFITASYATPGKKVMGLKVVYATLVLELPGRSTFCVYPATKVGWFRALIRTSLKNAGIIAIPIYYRMFTNTNDPRIGHDYLAKTLVIDTAHFEMRLMTELTSRAVNRNNINQFINGNQ